MAQQAKQNAGRRQPLPDESGFFGAYGGQFLPPQLEAPFAEIVEGLPRDRERRLVHRRAALPAQALPGAAHAGLPRAHAVARQRRRADLPEARGSEPHRRPQAQPLHGRGPAGQVHGQEEGHRRDRRRSARRGVGHGRRPFRPRVRDPHGRGRHREAGAQRQSHAAPGRHGRARLAWPQDAQGGRRLRLRGVSRRLRELHLLHRLGGRAASLPAHGARLPARRGHRSSRAVPGDDRRPPRCGGGVRRRRLQCDRHLHGLPRRLCRADRRGAAGARRGRRRARRDHDLRP